MFQESFILCLVIIAYRIMSVKLITTNIYNSPNSLKSAKKRFEFVPQDSRKGTK